MLHDSKGTVHIRPGLDKHNVEITQYSTNAHNKSIILAHNVKNRDYKLLSTHNELDANQGKEYRLTDSIQDDNIIDHLRRFIQGCYKRVDDILHNMTNTWPVYDSLSLQVPSQDQDNAATKIDINETSTIDVSTGATEIREVSTQDNDMSQDNLLSQTSECKIRREKASEAQSELSGRMVRLKVAINNISGLGVCTNKLHRVMEWMQEQQFDILMAQEANVHFKHHQVRHYLCQVLNSGYHIVTSESEFSFKTPTKPGGTFILTSRLFRSRIIQMISDPVGRWAGNIYSFSGELKIALISVYQICHWKIRAAQPLEHNKLHGYSRTIGMKIQSLHIAKI